MTQWKPISEVGDCADILAGIFDSRGCLIDVAPMTLVNTERGKFWAYSDWQEPHEDDGTLYLCEPWDALQPEYFIPLPKMPDAILAQWEIDA